jgi:Mg2+ and Co2+ transporter CorA
MLHTYTQNKGIVWKHLTNPTVEELTSVMRDMHIGDEYLEELQTPTPQPVCTRIGTTIYAVFHVPLHKKEDTIPLHYIEEELDILIRENTIVTISYSPLETFDIDPDYALSHHKTSTATDLCWHILTHVYKNTHKEVDTLVTKVKELREKVFTDTEHIETISNIHRAYLAIDFPINTHTDIIESMLEKDIKVAAHIIQKTQGELNRLTGKLDKLGAYIHELRDTQSTLISARQSGLMQTFTILTFMFLPINFLAALFGMNVINMPVVTHPLAFWILSVCFGGLSLLLLIFFKIRKWL